MNGIIILNKEQNCTSHDMVYKAKKILNEKIGHTGTLDPMATGVLPLLVGKGTLCSKYLINHDKIYQVQMQLGKKTDTADGEGNIIEEKEVNYSKLKEEVLKEILATFLGKQMQIPPMYSAIKVKGKKLYEYARKGETVEVKAREIEIYNIKLINIDIELNKIEFEVKCSKGTYIRSLCEDIAVKTGNIAYMSKLNRIEVGEFNIQKSIKINELELQTIDEIEKSDYFISLEELFVKNKKIILNTKNVELLLNGVKITQNLEDGEYKIYSELEEFLGIAVVKNKLLKRDIII